MTAEGVVALVLCIVVGAVVVAAVWLLYCYWTYRENEVQAEAAECEDDEEPEALGSIDDDEEPIEDIEERVAVGVEDLKYQNKRLTDAAAGWRDLARTLDRKAALSEQLSTAVMILADKRTLPEALAELRTDRKKKRPLELAEETQLNKALDVLKKGS